jgi:hypothetical protein
MNIYVTEVCNITGKHLGKAAHLLSVDGGNKVTV